MEGKMSRNMYFSKVSLDSKEVYDLVDNYELRFKYTNDILLMLKHGAKYTGESTYIDEDGEEHTNRITYTLSVRHKDDTSIYGFFDRTTNLFVKKRDDITGELKTSPVPNTEGIEFYYDVLHEYIAFSVRSRFRQNMFNDAFAELMNICAKKEGFTYSFYLGLYNEGLSIEEIKESIKKDKNIKELIITYRPANPDEKLIEKAKEASESERIREANATERSVIYKAKGNIHIDGSASVIQEDLDKLVELNAGMPIEEMTKYSYAEVKSINDKGAVNSTAATKPYIYKYREDLDGFVESAKHGITHILSRLFVG